MISIASICAVFTKLIATTVNFGKWNLPLNFINTETGGSCLPGCHQKILL